MSIATETASEYFLLAAKAAEHGEVSQALHYSERGQELLLRPSVEIEQPGILVGEHVNYGHFGKVIAAKREKAMRG